MATDPITCLKRAVSLLSKSGDPRATRVGNAIANMLQTGIDFRESMEMATDWFSVMRRRELDAALRRLREGHFQNLKKHQAARAMAAAGQDYETRQWPRDRAARRRPDGLAGELYDICLRGGMPSEDSLLRRK